ncbi:MAG TPA: LysE family transporter [Allosphingosinicella sp.]|uniref:LysE family translocator n=1 Tax=Allosphingosinicella sp. TaxID=2823234 RepID=UPI002ED8F462
MNSDLAIVITTLSIYLAVAISPGPNFALVSRLAMANSRSAGFAATLGIAVGATFYACLTMTGLAVLLDQVGWLARLIQIGGGCYLIYLGIKAWQTPKQADSEAPVHASTNWQAFRAALVVSLANPKSIAFFIGLYALAIPAGTALWAKGAIVGGGFLIEILWYGAVSFLLSTQKARSVYQRFGAWIERGIGTLLAGFGVKLITQRA